MSLQFFCKGLFIGFSIAAPVGPIGVLCIRRTLAHGRACGFASGLGAATADALYGCIAGFGLTALSSFLTGQQNWLRLGGGLFLIYLGAKTCFSRPAEATGSSESPGLAGAFLSTLFLTLTNPMTILSFGVVFAGLGLGAETGNYLAAGFLVLGVFLGSALWWLLLSGGIGIFRERFTVPAMQWVNRITGALIIGFGLLALWSGWK
jgi:threonine/homoserine/homoserine lactone efflux protein